MQILGFIIGCQHCGNAFKDDGEDNLIVYQVNSFRKLNGDMLHISINGGNVVYPVIFLIKCVKQSCKVIKGI